MATDKRHISIREIICLSLVFVVMEKSIYCPEFQKIKEFECGMHYYLIISYHPSGINNLDTKADGAVTTLILIIHKVNQVEDTNKIE